MVDIFRTLAASTHRGVLPKVSVTTWAASCWARMTCTMSQPSDFRKRIGAAVSLFLLLFVGTPGSPHRLAARGAPIPGLIWNGPAADGCTSKSKIDVGMYTVEQEFGMSTTPDNRPSMGAAPSSR